MVQPVGKDSVKIIEFIQQGAYERQEAFALENMLACKREPGLFIDNN